MSNILKNKKLSLPFRLEVAKREQRKYLFKETLSLLILLYAHQFEAGTKRVSDFSRMDSREFTRELLLRTMMLDGQIRSKTESHKKRQQEETTNVLEALKAASK